MPTKKSEKAKSKAKKVEEKKINTVNWDTTDEDEIKRRKIRAAFEKIHVTQLGRDNDYYTSFVAYSDLWANHDNAKYLVEIRSLNEKINSCNCLDFQINDLGTCKHIEKTLLYLNKQGKRKFQQIAGENSPWIEVFLDHKNDNKVTIQWPKSISKDSEKSKTIDAFFATNNTLIGDPLLTFPALKSACKKISLKNKIRISSHIDPYLKKIQNNKQKEIQRKIFEADIKTGKRDFNIVKYPLYPYQQEGLMHLAFNERALLADEMGLGKTVQAIAACELLRKTKNIQRVLIVATASLKTEWEEQIAKFSDLNFLIIQGSRKDRLKLYQTQSFFYLTNYEQILHDGADMQRLISPDVIILDEAQRIKNWQTKTAKAIKRLSSPYAFVLTGTPLENRIDDIYSIVQFLDPHLLGPLFKFNREFYQLDENGRPAGYKNLDELHRRLRPILLRRQKSDVEEQLPERTVNHFFVSMDPEQSGRYEEYSTKVARLLYLAKKRPLRKEEFELLQKYLACMRMLCDTPYILDQECRISPKLQELENILEELLEDKNTKILIFSEWERMLQLVKELAVEMKIEFAWHTGSVPQKKRRNEINRFKNDPACRLFLSTDSGSVGLNLQAANVVINMDLPWNPAKLEQRIARAWRKYQTRNVKVINLVAESTIEHRMIGLLEQKQALANNVLYEGKIKTMQMPSGQVAFIERLEALMNATPTSPATLPAIKSSSTEQQPAVELSLLDIIENDLLARAPNNLLLINRHKKQSNDEILFIVVEPDDKNQIHSHIQQTLQNHKADKAPNIEILDKQTYEALQRLSKLGIISINQDIETLLNPNTQSETKRKQQNVRIKKSRDLLNQIERKYNMAKLLINGDFHQEAIPALKDATRKTLIAYSYAHNYCNNLDADLSQELQNQLTQDTKLSNELFLNCWQQCSTHEQIESSEIKKWLAESKTLYDFVGETLTKLAMS